VTPCMTGEGSGSSASGLVEDVTSHAATRAVVDEYVAWYDRHLDPDWRDILLTPPDATGERSPWGYVVPKSAADLSRMGRCFSKTTFLSAGNLTHTPAYGQLIVLGVLCATQEANVSPKQIGDAAAYRDLIAATGRFLTFSAGAATIGYRMREDPASEPQSRSSAKPMRVSCSLARSACTRALPMPRMSMSAHFRVSTSTGIALPISCPVAAPGVTVICRKKLRPRGEPVHDTAQQPLRRTRRADVARRRVHPLGARLPAGSITRADSPLAVLASALLLALESGVHLGAGARLHACDGATRKRAGDPIVDVQTVRSCQIAGELDPEFSSRAIAIPTIAMSRRAASRC
jgi:hypothetical protein